MRHQEWRPPGKSPKSMRLGKGIKYKSAIMIGFNQFQSALEYNGVILEVFPNTSCLPLGFRAKFSRASSKWQDVSGRWISKGYY